MSETSENPTVRTSTATAPAPRPSADAPRKTPKVFQIAAWVATVAGIVFIVAIIFFTGYALGKHSGHHGGHHHKHHAMVHPHRFGGPGGPGGPIGPGGPGSGPATSTPSPVRPGGFHAGPGQAPTSVFRSLSTSPSGAVGGEAPTVIVLAG